MTKSVDKNGYWFIPKNPISRAGIFDYLGSSISDECEPNKVYKVFRSGETLLASVPTWDNPPKPFINDHEMLGEGFTEVDARPVQGVITNPQYEDGVLYADITVYSESLKELIENGKKELSLGYFCKFEKQSGVYDGEAYDYVQIDMIGNHIALVDAGRCGSDVKVYDRKCVMDSFDITPVGLKKECDSDTIESTETTETKDSEMAKYVLVSEVDAILKEAFSWGDGGVDPKAELIAKLLDAKAIEGVVPTTDEDDSDKEKKAEDKCGKDEESKEEEKKTEDSEKEEEVKDNEEEKEVKDESLSLLKKIADGIDELLKKSADEKEEETKDESETEESKTEDSEEESKDEDDKEEKETGDGILFTFGQDKATDGEDPAIKAYLA